MLDRQVAVAESNVVLLHPQSLNRADKAQADWNKRKAEHTRKGVKRERVTFFAAQYDLTEPLLEQFGMYMAAAYADKTSYDFVGVSSFFRVAVCTLCIHSLRHSRTQISNHLSKFLWFATNGKGLMSSDAYALYSSEAIRIRWYDSIDGCPNMRVKIYAFFYST